jgi:hypothetical protein
LAATRVVPTPEVGVTLPDTGAGSDGGSGALALILLAIGATALLAIGSGLKVGRSGDR